MLSSEFIGTDIRPFISEKRNKDTNELLGPGRGLKNEQRIKHLTQEIDLSISVPYFLKSQRKGSRPHQMYDSEEWGELVDYWKRFQRLRPGNYFFPDGSELYIESNECMLINTLKYETWGLKRDLPILDIAEWLSNPFRINAIKNWADFILLLDCIVTTLPDIINEERWSNWIKENSWRGIDSPFQAGISHCHLNSRIPPFLEYIERKYRKEGDTNSTPDVIRENIISMEDKMYGLIGESWAYIYHHKENFFEEYRIKSIPILVTHNHRLKILTIEKNKLSTCPIGNDPRDWRKLMTWAMLPPRSEGLEFIQGLFMNWNEENDLWKPSLRQIRSARLLHDEIEKLGEKSSLIPVDYNEENSGILVIGSSGTTYIISPFETKLKVDAIPMIADKNRAESVGIDLCIDPLIAEDLPFGDVAVGYLLALYNDVSSRNQIFTLDFFLQALDENEERLDSDNHWTEVEQHYHLGLESMHEFMGERMDEDMENRIAEYENEQEILRQQEEYEQQKQADEEENKIMEEIDADMERLLENFCSRLERTGNGDYCE